MKKALEILKPMRDEKAVQNYNKLHLELNQYLNQEELYWKHRSKQFWLNEGDRNTRYFHKYASARKQKNSIG